ncbi:MAG: YlbF family regulator [Oscillospiraceae bacterium]
MDAILNFKEAARALQQDDRYRALDAARKANDADEKLQAQIGEFNLLRMELNNEMSKQDKDDAKVAKLNDQVSALYSDIMENESMIAYNQAKDEIEGFMEHVNAILNAAIDGRDPMEVDPPQHSCGEGGCSSCAGCH